MLFALFSSAFIIWSTTVLPDWIKENESQHNRLVQDRFAAMQTGLDGLSASGERGPFLVTYPLGADAVTFLQSIPSTGHAFIDGSTTTTLTAPGAIHHFSNGAFAGTADQVVTSGLTDISNLRAMELALTTTNIDVDDQAVVTLTFTDGTATVTFQLAHKGSNLATNCAGAEVAITVTGSGTRHRPLLCEAGKAVTSYTVDVLEPTYGLPAALTALDAPYSMTGSVVASGAGSPTATASFAAVHSTPDGRLVTTGGGEAATNLLNITSDRLVFEPFYREYGEQITTWEGGAILAVQPETAAVVSAPAFTLMVNGSRGYVDWTFMDLSGTGDLQGTSEARIEITHQGTRDVILSATDATFTIQGDHASAWRRFLMDEVLASGAADASVTGTGDTASLVLSTGTVTEWTLRVRTVSTTVEIA